MPSQPLSLSIVRAIDLPSFKKNKMNCRIAKDKGIFERFCFNVKNEAQFYVHSRD